MPVDVDKVKDALDAFSKDDYVTAKEILKKEIQAAKNSYLKDTVGLEKEVDVVKGEKEEEGEDEGEKE